MRVDKPQFPVFFLFEKGSVSADGIVHGRQAHASFFLFKEKKENETELPQGWVFTAV